IQLATLDLAVKKGLENVTTEEIAATTGISTRTFFNYYTNKETAAVGAPPPLFGGCERSVTQRKRTACGRSQDVLGSTLRCADQ
ncbi:MAG: TetR/AcrR family transcriptional regulator, partial [Sulfitobacter sp.]|nr:TetR/AcrR family transcriptional regulator [Sulfitobacter sp.]